MSELSRLFATIIDGFVLCRNSIVEGRTTGTGEVGWVYA